MRLKPRRPCARDHLHANVSGGACCVVAHQLHTVIAASGPVVHVSYIAAFESTKLHDVEITSSRLCALLVRDSLFTASGTLQTVQLHKKEHVVGTWSRNLARRITVNLTPSLDTRITTSLRLLCCGPCCRICSDVSRWRQMSNVCRKSSTQTSRHIWQEKTSEDVSLDVAFARSGLPA